VDADELIRRADTAMYETKSSGRDGYALFHAADQSMARRRHLLDLLSRALVEQRVVIHYQPLVRVSDHGIVGIEALLRLRDDDGSLVPPLDFLPLALEGRTLIPIEHEVIRRASAQVARWVADGHDLRLCVNVCAEQLSHITDFEHFVDCALAESGLDAGRLVCELTEHHLLDLSEATVAGITRLVQRGVRMSIDDFGTGFGSLSYLSALPIHELKIDRSFVAGPRGTSGAILRSIAGLALDLGMGCVAEGVETQEQHDLVREAGVPHAQGYLYSPAVDPEALGAMLRSGLPPRDPAPAGTT
jgi:EAL domain-containing protein (putative c-di-GMP-specific phosphodiesterase class I)